MASFRSRLESSVPLLQSSPDLLRLIKDIITSSGDIVRVYSRVTPEFKDVVAHRFPNGISEVTSWVVEPCNEMALRGLMELLAGVNISFGLKSGGHISVPKIYPPEQGILIYMRQFNRIEYDKQQKTLDVGAGVIWKDIYKYLEPHASSEKELGVVGGDPLVGVSGWLLGGGYSILTNKFGLGMDNIVTFRVLLPGAKAVSNVSLQENPEIFKALKGGGHNFGIVTQFTLRVYEHAKRADPVSRSYPESKSSDVKEWLVSFIEGGPQPEEVVVAVFRHDLKDGQLKSVISLYGWGIDSSSYPFSEKGDLAQFFFSDGDPQSMSLAKAYETFSLRHLPVSLDTLQTDGFVDLDSSLEMAGNTFKAGDLIESKTFEKRNEIDLNSLTVFTAGNKAVVMESPTDLRGRMACIMVSTYTRTLIDEAEKQAKVLSTLMKEHKGIRASFEIWPFHKGAFNNVKREDSAWPHEEGAVFGPLVGWFEWSGKDNDEFWLGVIAKALEGLHQVALKEKCTTEKLPMYLNITLENTLVKDIYRDNYEQLKGLRRKYDPNNVMGLAAGFIINANEE